MDMPFELTAPPSVQNSMKSSSRRFNSKSMSLDDRDYLLLMDSIIAATKVKVITVNLDFLG